MTARGLIRLVAVDLRRQLGPLAAAAIGVVVGTAALMFFLGLVLGARTVLLGEVFPIDRIEVAPASRNLDLLALRFQLGSDTLTAEQLAQLKALAGIAAVYPKIHLTVPALASGGEALLGTSLQTEVVVDGIDAGAVAADADGEFRWSPLDPPVPCVSDDDCPEGAYCGDGVYGPAGACRNPVPALVSHHLLELYNGSFRRAYRLPMLNPDFAIGLQFEVAFGATTFRTSTPDRVVRERVRLAGFSDKAIALGLTLPLDVVRHLNNAIGSHDEPDAYHSAIVTISDKAEVSRVVEAVREMDLVIKDRGSERVAALLSVIMVVIAVVGGAMVAVAAVSVAHAFFVVVSNRRREIGVFRAVGARRTDVAGIIHTEAAVVGAVAGGFGAAVAVTAAAVFDRMAAAQLPDFPYKPESFFLFPWWLAGAVWLLAVVACVAGAYLPGRRAASVDPADALGGR